MKAVIRLLVLAAIVGTIVVMVKTGTGSTVIGGAVVILVLLLIFRKTVTPSRRNRSQGGSGGGGSRSLPSHSEIMQIINDYVGYYATGFNCNITPNHIYITVTFRPGTSAALANQKAMDLCNEISSTYGISVSVN